GGSGGAPLAPTSSSTKSAPARGSCPAGTGRGARVLAAGGAHIFIKGRNNTRGAGIPPAATSRRNTRRPQRSPARRPPLRRAIPAPLAPVRGSQALGSARAARLDARAANCKEQRQRTKRDLFARSERGVWGVRR